MNADDPIQGMDAWSEGVDGSFDGQVDGILQQIRTSRLNSGRERVHVLGAV